MKLKKEIKNKIKNVILNVILKLTLYYKIDRIKLLPNFASLSRHHQLIWDQKIINAIKQDNVLVSFIRMQNIRLSNKFIQIFLEKYFFNFFLINYELFDYIYIKRLLFVFYNNKIKK